MVKTKDNNLRATWYCHNCGTKVVGIRRPDGLIVTECSNCHTAFARSQHGRHHQSLEIYTSKYRPTVMNAS